MLPCMKLMGKDLRINFKEFIALFILSAFYAATSMFLTMSYKYIASGIATTIHFLYPIAVALWMMLFFKEKLSKLKAFAIGCAIFGVFFLSGGFSPASNDINLIGVCIVLITVITYSTYLVCVNNIKIIKQIDSAKIAFYGLTFSSVYCLINVIIQGNGFYVPKGSYDWICMVGLALLPTLLSDLTLVYAVKYIGSTTTAILGCLEPLTATVIGILYFKEQIRIEQFAGMAFVFAAVYIIILNQNKKTANNL